MNPTCKDVVAQLQREYGELFRCVQRGETLEIQTPFSTVTRKFVSVFISANAGGIVVSDGGWLLQADDPYGLDLAKEDEEALGVFERLSVAFSIRTAVGPGGMVYYRRCERMELLSAAVHDVAQFVTATAAAVIAATPAEDQDEPVGRFPALVNRRLLETIPNLHQNYQIPNAKGVVFSAAVVRTAQVSLVMYVTGSSPQYFQAGLRKAILNYQILAKSSFRAQVRRRLALLDDQAAGYKESLETPLMGMLEEGLLDQPAMKWSTEGEALTQALSE